MRPAIRHIPITAFGQALSDAPEIAVGASIEWQFTFQDPDSSAEPRASLDLTGYVIQMSLCEVSSGSPSQPPIHTWEAEITNLPGTDGLATISWSPEDTAPFEGTPLAAGNYAFDVWGTDPLSNRLRLLSGTITLLAAETLPSAAFDPPPETPGGAYPVGVPTIWRGPNMGVSGGVGPTLDNSNPVLGAGSNDTQGDVAWNEDGGGATGTVYWTVYFSAPRGSVTVYTEPLTDFTDANLYSLRHVQVVVLEDSQGRAVGFTFGTQETLDAQVLGMHVKYTVVDTCPITIVSPPARTFQHFDGVSDPIDVTLAVSGTHDVDYSGFDGAWHEFQRGMTGTVTGTIPGQIKGFGSLRFRARDVPGLMAAVQIGVGSIAVSTHGQSNGVGQAYAMDWTPGAGDALPFLYRLDGTWSRLKDPSAYNVGQVYAEPANATSFGGSTWVALVKEIAALSSAFRSQGFGLLNCAQDSSLASSWAQGAGGAFDTSTLAGQSNQRVKDMGGCDQYWCWLGEGDAVAGTSTSAFKTQFTANMASTRAALNSIRAGMGDALKVFCAKIMKITSGGVQQSAIDAINEAYDQMLADNTIQGLFDFSALTPSDGVVHVVSQAQATQCAQIAAPVVKSVMGY